MQSKAAGSSNIKMQCAAARLPSSCCLGRRPLLSTPLLAAAWAGPRLQARAAGTASAPTQDVCHLNCGAKMPMLGLGTFQSEDQQVAAAVEKAADVGYRHVDTAAIYGNEKGVGEGLRRTSVPREEIFVVTKLWNEHHERNRVAKEARESLKKLQTSYIDLYLMHWPVTGKEGPTLDPPLLETWEAMEKLVDEGLVRAIGVSNFTVEKLEDFLPHVRITPAVNQVEVNPYNPNKRLLDYCKSKSIHVTAYSPLGWASNARDPKNGKPLLLEDPVVLEVAQDVGKTPAQVLLAWGMSRGYSVIPKSKTPEHIKSNFGVYGGWDLPREAAQKLDGITTRARMIEGSAFLSDKGPYRTLDELWDGEATT